MRTLCNAIFLLSFSSLLCGLVSAEEWLLQYDANRLNPDNEQPAAGWEGHNSSPGASTEVKDGILRMDTKVERGGLWFAMKQRSDAWAYAIAPTRNWSAEVRARVTESGGDDGGLTLWIGNGNRQTAYLVIGARSLKWGTKKRGGTTLKTGLDNFSDFHTYRIDFDAKTGTFTVSRDKKRIARDLTNASPYPYRWFVFGDPGSTCQMKAEIDWIRYKTQGGPNLYTMVALGDSTSVPGRNNVKAVYSELLPGTLKAKKVPVAVVNSSRPGLHTGRAAAYTKLPRVKRHPQALDIYENEVLNFDPEIVLLQFGINDSWIDGEKNPKGPSRTPLEQFAANLDTMILTSLDAGSKVVLMTPNPLGAPYDKWRDDRLALYAQVVRNIAKREGLPLVDVRRLFQTYARKSKRNTIDDLLQDGMHPNHIGHKIIADDLTDKLAFLTKPPTFRKVDLAKTLPMRVVATENGAPLVQANTARLPGDRIVAAYQKRGSNQNQVRFARSLDGGAKWAPLPTPDHFDLLDINSPTLHAAGNTLFCIVSYPRMAISHSADAGQTWSPLYPMFPPDYTGKPGDTGVRPPSSLLSNGPNLIMTWHDAITLRPRVNFGLFQSTSKDAGRTWSLPESIGLHPKFPGARPADPVLLPNPRTGDLICIAKDADQKYSALWMLTTDNGATWSDLNGASAMLQGDRHAAIRSRDGRIVMAFRDRNKKSKWFGDTVVWVGTDNDLKYGTQGQYLARVMENPASGGTPDIEVLDDGSFVVTTAYGYETSGAVRCVRFTVQQLDFGAASK